RVRQEKRISSPKKERTGEKHRGPYSKWKGRDLHDGNCHHCANDDRFTGFSPLQWAHDSARTHRLLYRWSRRFTFTYPESVCFSSLQTHFGLVSSRQEMSTALESGNEREADPQ